MTDLLDLADDLQKPLDGLQAAASQIQEVQAALRKVTPPEPPAPDMPWDRVIIDELAHNPGPWPKPDGSPSAIDRSGGWWQRTLDQIDYITFHHTLSHSPHATAAHYIEKVTSDAVGHPSIPYTVWISQTGEILLCEPLTSGLWHDHTGHRNTHLSVGLAGSLHVGDPNVFPGDEQLYAGARLVKWAVESPQLPLIVNTTHVKGHMDWIGTQCPGWRVFAGGRQGADRWKSRFQRIIAEVMA